LPYAFGHSDTAAIRLEAVARVFEPATRTLLRQVKPAARDLAIDLGCGPGYTTALLAEVLQFRCTAGLDLSADFIERAGRQASDRLVFHVHDITTVPFPEGPADLLYSRFLLTHLKNPVGVVARWATQLVPGGLLVLEEVESIATSSPVLVRYLEIVDQMLRSQSNRLYIGSELEDAATPAGLEKRRSDIRELVVAPVDAALMFALNLQTWREHPFVRRNFSDAEIEQLGRDLRALRADAAGTAEIVWSLRQLVYQRKA
jgi:SAM-dependent methyltransferase